MSCPDTVSQDQINQAVSLLQELFPQELTGIYLYGSAVLDGLRPESDIDILVIIDRPLTQSLRARLTQELLCLSGRPRSDRRPIELSVVNRHAIDPWRFPPRFEYMFGEWLRTDMENGTVPQPFSDPDNVLLLWQARLHAIPLTAQSPAIDKLIASIPFEEIRRAIRGALPNVLSSYKGDERNVLLTHPKIRRRSGPKGRSPPNTLRFCVSPGMPISATAPTVGTIRKTTCFAFSLSCVAR